MHWQNGINSETSKYPSLERVWRPVKNKGIKFGYFGRILKVLKCHTEEQASTFASGSQFRINGSKLEKCRL